MEIREGNGNKSSSVIKLKVTTLMLLIALLLISYSNLSRADNHEEVVLLSLKYKVDGIVLKDMTLYGNRINPNISSVGDHFSFAINGAFIQVPASVYNQLHQLRRSFSYNELSGGILNKPSSTRQCLLVAPAEGLVLETRYLTFNSDSLKVISSEVKPVFGLALNCLFDELLFPR